MISGETDRELVLNPELFLLFQYSLIEFTGQPGLSLAPKHEYLPLCSVFLSVQSDG